MHAVISTALMALPIVMALKLKFFMMLSIGIAALSLVSGKAFVLSMVSFVLAIVAILKKSSSKGVSINRIDELPSNYVARKSLDNIYTGGRAHKYYMK
ncbi:hypothetical protein L9F63_006360 [Diploptera punctata]|uniref:Uncharacterized protein n=1 Tax=Diploptera punctata TaxID=6984 RepID=A0AAD7ZB03_DIPPU|nr:hypothetical protein L9F63_006360 [Diploptera punctata]